MASRSARNTSWRERLETLDDDQLEMFAFYRLGRCAERKRRRQHKRWVRPLSFFEQRRRGFFHNRNDSDARKVSQNQGGGKMLENSPVFGSQLKIEEAPGAGKVALECVTGQCATSTVCRPSPPTSPSPMITEWIPVEQSSTSSSTSSSEDQQVSQCGNRGSCNRRGNDEKDFDEIIFDIIKSKKTARSAEDFFGVLIAKHLEQIPMKYRTRVECKLLNVISDAIDLYGIDETKKDGSHE